MESKNSELKVSFGPFNEKNAELVRALNLAIFPVQYHNWFYQALSNYVKYTRLGKLFSSHILNIYSLLQ